MSKYFITGGAGFIGSHLTDRLVNEGNTVTVYDNLITGRKKWIEQHFDKSGFHFIEADLLDLDTMKQAMEGHDIIWHLGANTDIRKGNSVTDLDLKYCTIATHNVLEAMRENNIDKILFASSGTVYGEPPAAIFSETLGPLLPISLYGAGKLACEGLLSAYSHLFNIKVWIFRFANVVGDRLSRGVIYDFIQKLRQNSKELEILGDGKQRKPFFSVGDCIEGMLCAFQKSNNQCDVYNLGCESLTEINTVARIVTEEMGLNGVKFRYTGSKRGWPGDQPVVVYDVSRMRNLGWEASYTSDETVRIATRCLLDGILG